MEYMRECYKKGTRNNITKKVHIVKEILEMGKFFYSFEVRYNYIKVLKQTHCYKIKENELNTRTRSCEMIFFENNYK